MLGAVILVRVPLGSQLVVEVALAHLVLVQIFIQNLLTLDVLIDRLHLLWDSWLLSNHQRVGPVPAVSVLGSFWLGEILPEPQLVATFLRVDLSHRAILGAEVERLQAGIHLGRNEPLALADTVPRFDSPCSLIKVKLWVLDGRVALVTRGVPPVGRSTGDGHATTRGRMGVLARGLLPRGGLESLAVGLSL